MNKGFTLIEVIAVIIVLSVVSLIVIPSASKTIKNARQKTVLVDAKNYVDSVKKTYDMAVLDDNLDITNGKSILETGFDDEELSKIAISGKKPTYVKIEYDKTKNTLKEGKFCIEGVSILYTNGEVTLSSEDYCNKKIIAGLYDADNKLLVTWDELINDYGMNMTDNSYNFKRTNIPVVDGDILNDQDSSFNSRYYTSERYVSSWVKVENGNEYMASLEEITSSKPAIVLAKNFNNAKRLVIDESVTEIPDNAFQYLENEVEVIIPSGITKIGDYAFADSNIVGIVIGNDVTTIGSHAFSKTVYMKDVLVPSNVASIGSYAFAESKLERITFLDGITSIGEYAFTKDYKLKDIKIPNSLTNLESYAFYDSGLESVTFGTGLRDINKSTFENSKLKSISLPSNIKNIYESAFSRTSISEVNLGSVEFIDNLAFASCNNLTSIVIPSTVQKIGPLFVNKPSLTFEEINYWTSEGKCQAIDFSDPSKNADKVLLASGLNPGKYIIHYSDMSACH